MSMSTMQAAVCLLFNDAVELSYKEVQVCSVRAEQLLCTCALVCLCVYIYPNS
jgi:hypothetical protein